MYRATLCVSVVVFAVCCLTTSVQAVPILQLYLEGGVYDTGTESWEVILPGSSGGVPIRLWAMGNVGAKGNIKDVKLSIAYDILASDIDFSIAGSTTGGYNGVIDPSVAANPTLDRIVTDGSVPVLGDGSNLAPHGIYGPDTAWHEYSLGDFVLVDSPIGDFIGGFPTVFPAVGQINVLEILVETESDTSLHFDLYNTVEAKNHAKFAPFSHDGDGHNGDGGKDVIPEPASVAIWSLLGLLGLAVAYAKRVRRRSA